VLAHHRTQLPVSGVTYDLQREAIHTPEVQRSHYIFQERKKSVRKLQDMVMEGVRGGAAAGGRKRQRAEVGEELRES
jgi:hypothetical protein